MATSSTGSVKLASARIGAEFPSWQPGQRSLWYENQQFRTKTKPLRNILFLGV